MRSLGKTVAGIALLCLSLVTWSSVGSAADLFFEDFESYAPNSNLIGQGGWTAGTDCGPGVPCGNTIIVAPGTGLGSQVANGQIDPGTFAFTPALRALTTPLSLSHTYELTFDAFALLGSSGSYGGSGGSHDAGVFLHGGAGWFAKNWWPTGSTVGWYFDARPPWGGSGSGALQFFPGGFDQPVTLSVIVDPTNGEVYGRGDFGSGVFETDHFPLSSAQIAAITQVLIFQDYRTPSSPWGGYLGIEIDNIRVRQVGGDTDDDGVLDASDNCPTTANPDQADNDSDGQGDVCDDDDDNDGILDSTDNCPFTANPDQMDSDGDGLGNACDADPDGDGVTIGDNCPLIPNPEQTDTDSDGVGDACDTDDDNDTVADEEDNCPITVNPGQEDLDGDSIGDACDADIDGDGVNNGADNCVLAANPGQDDTDGDSFGDVCDTDDDNDGVADAGDNCPLIANPDQANSDSDLQGDVCDGDLDGDGVANTADNCPFVPNTNQNDFDRDGQGDACDADIDGDGVGNSVDVCGLTPSGEVVDPGTGCSIAQLCPCEGPRGTTVPWKNHGQYVSCVAKSAESFVAQDLITEAEKDEMVSAAAQSACGDK